MVRKSYEEKGEAELVDQEFTRMYERALRSTDGGEGQSRKHGQYSTPNEYAIEEI